MPDGRGMRWVKQDHPTIYANLIGYAMTPFDVSLTFGEVGESTDAELLGIPKVKVTFSPEQAQNLQKLLTVAIDSYVRNNGQLRTSGAMDVNEFIKQLEGQGTKIK